jgi:hypothetical protein
MLLLIAAVLFDPQVLIETARADYNRLPAFVCHQRMERYHNNKRRDVIEATVGFSIGREVYSDVTRNGKPRKSIRKIGGIWSDGEYGSVLEQSVGAITSRDDIKWSVSPEGTIECKYFTTREQSDYAIIDEDSGRGTDISFSTTILFSPDHRIRSILMESLDKEPGGCTRHREVQLETSLQEVGGDRYLLPSRAYMHVTCADNDVDRNEIQFDQYRKFQVESTVVQVESDLITQTNP